MSLCHFTLYLMSFAESRKFQLPILQNGNSQMIIKLREGLWVPGTWHQVSIRTMPPSHLLHDHKALTALGGSHFT